MAGSLHGHSQLSLLLRCQTSSRTGFNPTIRVKEFLQSFDIFIVKIDIRVNFDSPHIFTFLLKLIICFVLGR